MHRSCKGWLRTTVRSWPGSQQTECSPELPKPLSDTSGTWHKQSKQPQWICLNPVKSDKSENNLRAVATTLAPAYWENQITVRDSYWNISTDLNKDVHLCPSNKLRKILHKTKHIGSRSTTNNWYKQDACTQPYHYTQKPVSCKESGKLRNLTHLKKIEPKNQGHSTEQFTHLLGWNSMWSRNKKWLNNGGTRDHDHWRFRWGSCLIQVPLLRTKTSSLFHVHVAGDKKARSRQCRVAWSVNISKLKLLSFSTSI